MGTKGTKRLTLNTVSHPPAAAVDVGGRTIAGRVHAVPMQSQHTSEHTSSCPALIARSLARSILSPAVMADEGERVRCSSTLLFGISVPLHDSGKGSQQVTLLAAFCSALDYNGIRPLPFLPHAFSEA